MIHDEYPSVRIGMFGFGIVGQGVVQYLRHLYEPSKTGLNIEVAKICVTDLQKPRDVQVDSTLLTTNSDEILENPSIDVVVEVMGGIEPAGPYILRALDNRKHVVTANKAFLTQPIKEELIGHVDTSYEMQQLGAGKWPKTLGGYVAFLSALTNKRNIGFEASVCGEIPVIDVVSSLPTNYEINALEGIINGTSNYILTRMSQGADYANALKEAQLPGKTRGNIRLDVDEKLSTVQHRTDTYVKMPTPLRICQRIVSP